MIETFEDLVIWQSGIDITKQVYAITSDGELSKDR